MILETAPIVFGPWLAEAAIVWIGIVGRVVLACLLGTYVILALVHGPMLAGERLVSGFLAAVGDLWHTSPRRVGALAWLAIQESLRRRAIAGLAVFLVVLAFALWFLDTDIPDPTALYLGFVLWAITVLSLLMGVLLSVFSLPNDLKNKTLYTIVTKPVRASEIVLGRMLGFVAIGTVQLAVMGAIGYVFVVRALDHTHVLTDADLKRAETTSGGITREVRQGKTSSDRDHFHIVTDHGDGVLTTDERQGHWHSVTVEERGGKKRYALGGPQGQFHARAPIYGKLTFRDKAGNAKSTGVNVGKIWTYRGYIEGGTLDAGVWSFSDVTPERFPEGLPIDLNIRIFRTHKGDIEQGVVGSLVLRNPRTKVTSAPHNFIAKEFVLDRHNLPRKINSADGRSLDLFADLVDNGQVELQLNCLQRGMFFGMAQPDVYLLASEGSVAANFLKGFTTIWFQMVLVIGFGVMWSTFLNGAVAMLATFGVLLGGFFHREILKIAENKVYGGATFESLVRIAGNKNVMVELDPGMTTNLVKWADDGVRAVLGYICQVLPDLKQMSSLDYLSSGFDIPWERLAAHGVTTLGFVVPLFLIGFVCFKAREVAA